MNNIIKYYVKDGMVVFGDVVAAELKAGEYQCRATIMGVEVIVGDGLSLRGDFSFLKEYVANYGFNFVGENEISVPFVFDSAHDASEYAKMWTLTKLDELKALMRKNGYTDRTAFLLLNNQILPVRMRGADGDMLICEYLDTGGRTPWIKASRHEVYYSLEPAFADLYLSLP